MLAIKIISRNVMKASLKIKILISCKQTRIICKAYFSQKTSRLLSKLYRKCSIYMNNRVDTIQLAIIIKLANAEKTRFH